MLCLTRMCGRHHWTDWDQFQHIPEIACIIKCAKFSADLLREFWVTTVMFGAVSYKGTEYKPIPRWHALMRCCVIHTHGTTTRNNELQIVLSSISCHTVLICNDLIVMFIRRKAVKSLDTIVPRYKTERRHQLFEEQETTCGAANELNSFCATVRTTDRTFMKTAFVSYMSFR